MKRFIEGADRTQVSLLPECVEDYVEAENPVRVIEAFFEQLDLRALGFEGIDPEVTGRPAYPPSVLLKIPCTEPANSAVERRKWRDCSRFALYKHRWRNRVRETSIDSPNPSAAAPWGLRFMGPIKERLAARRVLALGWQAARGQYRPATMPKWLPRSGHSQFRAD